MELTSTWGQKIQITTNRQRHVCFHGSHHGDTLPQRLGNLPPQLLTCWLQQVGGDSTAASHTSPHVLRPRVGVRPAAPAWPGQSELPEQFSAASPCCHSRAAPRQGPAAEPLGSAG